jgi:uncharacterized hydrophobic protein (TIGR00271 family)
MGLVRNSGAVVIAAMLIAPLMAPILGIAAAMVIGSARRIGYLLLYVLMAAVFTVSLSWLLVYVSDVPRGIIIPDQVLARTDPGIEDLIVALAAGIAGAYVQIHRSEISLLPGAAIGVSLVPPLSAAGILLYFGTRAEAYEAVLLFTTNLAAIILSACAVYISAGTWSTILNKGLRIRRFSVGVATTVTIMTFIVLQLGQATYNRYIETETEALLAERIEEWAYPVSVEIVRLDVDSRNMTAELWAIVDLPLESQYRIASVASLLPEELTEIPISTVFEEALGEGYEVTVKYQTRITGHGVVQRDTENRSE